jgi:hypothetical protein
MEPSYERDITHDLMIADARANRLRKALKVAPKPKENDPRRYKRWYEAVRTRTLEETR